MVDISKQYNDVIVTRKGLFGRIKKFKGTILKDKIITQTDWLEPDYNERYITIQLDNGKKIKIVLERDGYTLFYKYSFQKI